METFTENLKVSGVETLFDGFPDSRIEDFVDEQGNKEYTVAYIVGGEDTILIPGYLELNQSYVLEGEIEDVVLTFLHIRVSEASLDAVLHLHTTGDVKALTLK